MHIPFAFAKRPESQPERVGQKLAIRPPVDIYESSTEYVIVADLPGATKESVHVHLENGNLSIDAHRAEDAGPLKEHGKFDYHRVFAVPQTIDANRIEAEYVAGVLKVRLPKPEAPKPRRIEVRVGG